MPDSNEANYFGWFSKAAEDEIKEAEEAFEAAKRVKEFVLARVDV